MHLVRRGTGARSGSTAFPGPRCPWRRRRRRCSPWCLVSERSRETMPACARACNRSRRVHVQSVARRWRRASRLSHNARLRRAYSVRRHALRSCSHDDSARRRCSRSAGVALAAASPRPASALDEPWMTEEAMRAAFIGKTLDGHYGNGARLDRDLSRRWPPRLPRKRAAGRRATGISAATSSAPSTIRRRRSLRSTAAAGPPSRPAPTATSSTWPASPPSRPSPTIRPGMASALERPRLAQGRALHLRRQAQRLTAAKSPRNWVSWHFSTAAVADAGLHIADLS